MFSSQAKADLLCLTLPLEINSGYLFICCFQHISDLQEPGTSQSEDEESEEEELLSDEIQEPNTPDISDEQKEVNRAYYSWTSDGLTTESDDEGSEDQWTRDTSAESMRKLMLAKQVKQKH